MRVAISKASRRWGGAGTMATMLAEGLMARGHYVLFLCDPRSPLAEWAKDRLPYAPVLRHPDFPPLPAWRCARAFREHDVEVVLSSTIHDLRMAALAGRLMRLPVLVRRLISQPLEGGPLDQLLWRTVPTHFVANSRATLDALHVSRPPVRDEHITLIYNGIDVERFERAEPADLGLPPDALVVGWVARLEQDKAPLVMADAWRRIAGRVPNAHLLIVGRGGLERATRERLGDAPRVHWLGFRRDMPQIMQALDVLLLSSHKEPFGLVLVEAMAAGTPIVATAAGGPLEIVRPDVDGVLVPPRDPEALAAAVVQLAGDPERRQRMAAAGAARARAEFSHDRVVEQYEAVLERLVAQRARRR